MKPFKYNFGFMETTLEEFAWARPMDGYVWAEGKAVEFGVFEKVVNDSIRDQRDAQETRFLRWQNPASPRVTGTTPLSDHPTLFREFARLESTEESFLAFANQHGWLGVACFLESRTADGKITVVFGSPDSQGEALWRWRDAHLRLRKVEAVLAALQDKNETELQHWFHVEAQGVRYERTYPDGTWEGGWVCSAAGIRPWLWRWANEAPNPTERLIRVAGGWVQKEINDALGDVHRGTNSSVRVLLDVKKSPAALSLHIVPDTLLAAMWLQCARVLTVNPRFKACEFCGRWFEVSPGERRKNTMYCSPRCKLAAHRARVVIPMACKACGGALEVSVPKESGFGYIEPQDVACPACGVVTSELLPGRLLKVRISRPRARVKAGGSS